MSFTWMYPGPVQKSMFIYNGEIAGLVERGMCTRIAGCPVSRSVIIGAASIPGA